MDRLTLKHETARQYIPDAIVDNVDGAKVGIIAYGSTDPAIVEARGLLAAEGVFLYQNQKVFGGVARRALNNIIMIEVVNFIIGLSPGIDNWGHMGGLLGGAIFAFLGGPILKVEGITPDLRVVDTRESSDVLRAAVLDILIFGSLAVATIIFRGS